MFKSILITFLLLIMPIFAAPSISAAKNVSEAKAATLSVSKEEAREQFLDKYATMVASSLCMASYMADNDTGLDYLRNYGWELVPVTHKNGRAEPHFIIAMKYFPRTNKQVFIVAFKGSTSQNDWKLNFETSLVGYGGNTPALMEEYASKPYRADQPAVHKGFNKFIDTVLRQSVLDDKGELDGIFKLTKEQDDVFLILTGHSLGGAAATLLGERLLDLGISADELMVVTFGAPAIGNAAFADKLGGRMRLLRVTNPWDPVPGSLQTFFKHYKQFGTEVKYQVPAYLSSMQHPMSIYFDYSVVNLWKTIDQQRKQGLLPSAPRKKDSGEGPRIVIYGTISPGLNKHKELPDLRRYIIEEYGRLLPNYKLADINLDPNVQSYERIDQLAKIADNADYLIVFGIDIRQSKQEDLYYINLEQSLFDKQGALLSMVSYGKKIEPAYGNIFTSGMLFLRAKEELDKHLPFLNKQLWGDVK